MKVAKKDEFYRHELGYGKQTRTVVLPEEVDSENVHAELKDCILEVTKSRLRKSGRQIGTRLKSPDDQRVHNRRDG